MMTLTGRLEALAQQIKPGETMADIGTDHGFLPISLFLRRISPKVIMTDVSEKALARARAHGKGILGLSDDDFRAGDGLAPINPAEVNVVVLAGMGGILMTRILAADLAKAKTIGKFVFQPRNHPEVLRYWLWQNEFTILSECLVRERRNLCEIIVAAPIPTEQPDMIANAWPPSLSESDIRWENPPWLAFIHDPLAKEYLHRKLERELRVRREVQKRVAPDLEQLKELQIRIDYLKNLNEKRESNDEI
jgi:tRNA (adenine22-N1)-methyltransferase